MSPIANKVDAHHHVWDLSVRDEPWIDPVSMAPIRRSFGLDDLAPVASAAGVSATVLVQTLDEVDETRDFLALAAKSSLIAAVTGWVDLTAASVGDTLAELADGEGGTYLRGIRHGVQSEPDPEWLNRPEVRRGIAAVGSAGLLYELLTIPVQLPAAVRTVADLPDVPFVLDHCSKPVIPAGELEPWAGQIRSLAALPNVSCKLSGLVTEAAWDSWTIDQLRPFVEVVLEAFGTDRVLWGSDWPVCLLASSYEGWASTAESLTAGLSDDERTAIFGGNARRVYGLT